MNLNAIMEVAIGVLFVWILLAVITSAVQEWISQLFKWRPNMLEEAIHNILADDEAAAQFYSHPLIKALHSQGGTRRPSQIPSRQFASVVFDMLIKAGSEDSEANKVKPVFARLQQSIAKLKKPKPEHGEKGTGDTAKQNRLNGLANVMDTLLIDISAGVEKTDEAIGNARVRVEDWFNDAMDRLGGAYKRQTQKWGLIIGIGLALALNADSLTIANHLWRDPLVREALVAQAEQFQLPANQGEQQSEQATQYYNELQNISVPLGWGSENMPETNDLQGWLVKLGGILLSGMAAAQGAPYWFDIMRKILNFRSGGGSSEPAKG